MAMAAAAEAAVAAAAAMCGYIGRRAQRGYTPLILATMDGRADCARLLLDAGADTEVKDQVRARAGVACGGIGVVVDADNRMWCENACHFCFLFYFRLFHDMNFAFFCAPNRGAATEMYFGECWFL